MRSPEFIEFFEQQLDTDEKSSQKQHAIFQTAVEIAKNVQKKEVKIDGKVAVISKFQNLYNEINKMDIFDPKDKTPHREKIWYFIEFLLKNGMIARGVKIYKNGAIF